MNHRADRLIIRRRVSSLLIGESDVTTAAGSAEGSPRPSAPGGSRYRRPRRTPPRSATAVEVLQPFDAVRAGVAVSALALVDEHLRGELEAILRDVVELTGFQVAAVARLRDDDHLQMIAEVGAGISPEQMEESAIPLDLWLACVGQSGDWGLWKFSSAEDVSEEVLAHTWIADLPDATGEDDWDPRNELVCPIYDTEERLVASLLVDVPGDGKLPGAARRQHLNQVGALASRAILAAIEREETRQRLRLLHAVRAAAAPSDESSFGQVMYAATAALEAGVVADRVGVVWFASDLTVEQRTVTPTMVGRPRWTDAVVDRDQVVAWWSHDEVGRTPPRRRDDGSRQAGLLVVPIGTDRACLGALALERSAIRAPWTRAEVRGAREFAAELAHAAQQHLGRREEQQLVDELRETVEEHSRLAAGVRHDLGAPLGAIRNYLDLLTTAQDNPQLHQRILDALRVGTAEVQEVAQALHAFHRAEEAGDVLDDVPVDVVALLRETTELYTVRAENADLTLTLEATASEALVSGSATELRRVLSNLTSNAIKYTPSGGKVVIRVDRSEHQVTLSWTDTGIGMSAPELERIWDDFWRSDDPWVRSRPGTGLGMVIVARLVADLGGQVEIASEPQVGTTVWVRLPML